MKIVLKLLIVTLILSSCFAKRTTYRDTKDWIPGDWHPDKGTLLIQEFPLSKRTNKKMVKYLEKKYNGNYEVLDKKTMLSKTGEYSNTQKYKYAVLWHDNRSSITHVGASMSVSNHIDPKPAFYDRSTEKLYPTTKTYNNLGNKSYFPFVNGLVRHSKQISD